MHRLVKVADIVNGGFLQMSEILGELTPEAYALQWSVLDLGEVVAEERWDLNLSFIESSVARSPTGMLFSFDELASFASVSAR